MNVYSHPESWQMLYAAARKETDRSNVAYRVGRAETAIFRRAQDMGHSATETTERQAMNRAMHDLLKIRTKAMDAQIAVGIERQRTTRNFSARAHQPLDSNTVDEQK